MKVTTAWGEISASWVFGDGEIHIEHNGSLLGHTAELEKLVPKFKARSKSLSNTHWVVAVKTANEATAKAIVEAIANLAARETAEAEKAVARKRR